MSCKAFGLMWFQEPQTTLQIAVSEALAATEATISFLSSSAPRGGGQSSEGITAPQICRKPPGFRKPTAGRAGGLKTG